MTFPDVISHREGRWFASQTREGLGATGSLSRRLLGNNLCRSPVTRGRTSRKSHLISTRGTDFPLVTGSKVDDRGRFFRTPVDCAIAYDWTDSAVSTSRLAYARPS